eukprot:424802_1
MGNIQQDICESLNICGSPEEYRENELQNEIIPQYQQNNPPNDSYQNNNNNHNQQYNNQNNNNQQYNNTNTNTQYQQPATSNIKTYAEYKNPIQQQYTANNTTLLNYNNTIQKSKTPPYQQQQQQSKTPSYYQPNDPKSPSPINRNINYYDQINSNNIRLSYRSTNNIIQKVEKQCDPYCTQMLTKKIQEISNQNGAKLSYPQCSFPAPYNVNSIPLVPVSCCVSERNNIYFLPPIDEYFGTVSNVHTYDDLNDYKIPSQIQNTVINSKEGQGYVYHNIYKPLFDTNNSMKKRYDQWKTVNLNNLKASSKYSGDKEDLWLTLIAFSGFAAHRTVPFNPALYSGNKFGDIAFENDVTFLAFYQVRKGYCKYGAKAFFDKNFCIKRIYLSYNGRMYTPDENSCSKEEWEHAKWVWKVSVTVATYLVDMIAHCRFREAGGLIKAIQSTLNANHPIRRLLTPFTYGTVYANNVYNEYLKKNGLFHRAFAFTYAELARLMKDAMTDAPINKVRDRKDSIKYRWKFARKKCSAMKNCPDQIYPFYSDLYSFWVDTLDFVSNYVFNYYNAEEEDQSLLYADKEMVNFYSALIKNSGIDNKFKLKKYNITNMLTHFICNSTLWNSHLASAVSFQYLVEPNFTGLKINNGNSVGNNAGNYIEYCTVALSSGWNLMDFKGYNVKFNVNNSSKDTVWKNVLLNDGKLNKNKEYFDKYFNIGNKDNYNKQSNIAQYTAANPNHFACSVML